MIVIKTNLSEIQESRSMGYKNNIKNKREQITKDVAFSIFHDYEDLLKSKYSSFDYIDAYTALMELKEVCEKYTEVD